MHLIPREGWWIAFWCVRGGKSVISLDVCTPPTFIDGEWLYTDLELDPHAFADGRVEIHDEDEFLAACHAGLISRAEAREARAAAQEIEQCLRDRLEPFGRVGWQRLDEASDMGLPPITVLLDVRRYDIPLHTTTLSIAPRSNGGSDAAQHKR